MDIVLPMVDSSEGADNRARYALKQAADSYEWYKKAAIRARRTYRAFETTVALASVSIPMTVAIWPGTPIIPAVLGALVSAIVSLRAVFHWHDNYLRFSEAREAVNRELRLYHTNSGPYGDAATRDASLVKAVSAIEQSEMGGWLKIAASRQATSAPDDASRTQPQA